MNSLDTPQKKTIVIGIDNLFSAGGQRLVVDVLNQPPFQNDAVHLITLTDSADRSNLEAELPHYVVRHHVPMPTLWSMRSWYTLYKTMRGIQPDAVWTHLFFSNTVFRVLKPFVGYRVIATEHNTYTWKALRHRVLDKVLSLWTYRIVAVSTRVAAFTAQQERISPEKFMVIPNGIDGERIQSEMNGYTKEEAQRMLGFSPEKKYIVNIARLVTQKNHTLLIEAFAQFAPKFPEYELLIAGDGPLYGTLQEQIRSSGMQHRIHLLGHRTDVVRICQASEFFVLTSHIEGFALVCIEAMATGLPVLAPQVAGPDEYIEEGKNGYFISYDPNEIAEKMRSMAEEVDTNAEHFLQHAHATAARYDIAHTAANYNALLHEAKQP